MEKQRLDKIIASTGKFSRREVKLLVRQGRVLVDGAPARSAVDKYDPEAAEIIVNGETLTYRRHTWLMMNKPGGVLSATEDGRGQTVLDLLPQDLQRQGLFPVGRLDKDTEGLLLLTNDGPLAHRLLAPKSHVDKVYYVEVDGVLNDEDGAAVRKGVTLADGYTCLPGELEPLDGGSAAHITLHEGKYHQIKRMMAARGKPVTYLKRLKFGPLDLDPALAKGGWRHLNEGEIQALFRQTDESYVKINKKI